MSTKRWIIVFAIAAALLAAASLLLLRETGAAAAELWLDGEHIATLPLAVEDELLIETADGGWNRIVVSGGTIAVVEANCPDGVCVDRGAVQGGSPVVCLPHRLVIRFTGEAAIDGMTG